MEWTVKAKSLAAVLPALAGRRRVLDAGAGVGWLSARLAEHGHDAFAADIVLDGVLGLRAARVYLDNGLPFERIGAEFRRLPLRARIFDAVLFNASLHYADNPAAVIDEARRVLTDHGLLVVMNSPVHGDARSAKRAERETRMRLLQHGADDQVANAYRHFVRNELEGLLQSRFAKIFEVPFDPGMRFRLIRAAKGIVLQMELASFPILTASN